MPIELVRLPDLHFVGLILPDPGRHTLRLLFKYQDTFRAVCWVNIGRDGSLYLNPRMQRRGPMMHGTGAADGAGGVAQELWEAQGAGAVIKNEKVSHHASGWVKGGTRMSVSVAPRNVQHHTLIRQDDYAHPSRFDAIAPPWRSTDIVVPGQDGEPFELADDRPLTSRLWVAPLRGGEAEVPTPQDDPNARAGQTAIVIPATNLDGCQDLTYQITFFTRSGDWPKFTRLASVDMGT